MIITVGEKYGDFLTRTRRVVKISVCNVRELLLAVYYVYDNALAQRVNMIDPLWYTHEYGGQTHVVVEFEVVYF